CEAVRRVLWAHDGLIPQTGLLRRLFARFDCDPNGIVRWMSTARPREFAGLASTVVEHARRNDSVARELLSLAAALLDPIALRFIELGAPRLALMGGLAEPLAPLLSDRTRGVLVPPVGDALSGALRLAQEEAAQLVATSELPP